MRVWDDLLGIVLIILLMGVLTVIFYHLLLVLDLFDLSILICVLLLLGQGSVIDLVLHNLLIVFLNNLLGLLLGLYVTGFILDSSFVAGGLVPRFDVLLNDVLLYILFVVGDYLLLPGLC